MEKLIKDVQVSEGVQDAGLKFGVTPVGSPAVTEKVTNCAVPETLVRVIVELGVELPWLTVAVVDEAAMEKSKAAPTVIVVVSVAVHPPLVASVLAV